MSLLDTLSPSAKVALARRRAEQIQQDKSRILSSLPASEWIERYFWIPELRGPMCLYPYQRAVMNYALTRRADGTFPFSTIVWSDIKKSAKSSIAAAIGLWMAYQNHWSSIYAVANDLKQADSRVGYYMRRAIELNPVMAASCKVRGYRTELPNRSFIESIPIDPTGEAGSNADMVIFSELWGAHQEAQKRMWAEMTLSPTKHGHSFRWVETYAGYLGESELLYQLYELGTKFGEKIDLGIPNLEIYENRAARLLLLWNDLPRLPWQTSAFYAEEEAVLTPNEFRRLHRNQWVSSTQEFIPMEWWHACKSETPLPAPKKEQPVIFAIDAGLANDHFAIVGVMRHGQHVVPFYVRRWIPEKNKKLDFSNPADPLDASLPEGEIRRLAKAYNVTQFAYDEYQLHDLATRLKREGVGWFRPFPQTGERAIADKLLYDSIRDRRLLHDGDPVLEEALRNADAENQADKRLRLVKRGASLHIDAAVALSMANRECLRLNLE